MKPLNDVHQQLVNLQQRRRIISDFAAVEVEIRGIMRALVIFAFLVGVTSADYMVHNVPSSYEGGTKWELFGDGQARSVPQLYKDPVPVVKPHDPLKPFFYNPPVNHYRSSSAQDFFKKPYELPTVQQPVNYFRSAPSVQVSHPEEKSSQYLPPQNYGYHYEKPVYKYDY